MIRFKGISKDKQTIEGYYFFDKKMDKHYILNDYFMRFEVAGNSIRQLVDGNWIKIKELDI